MIAHGRDFLTEGVEDVVFCYLRFPSGRIAHMHLSWLDPHKMRRITVVGREKMVVFDDMELDQKVTIYDKAPESAPTSYGEWLTRTRRRLQPEDPERRAAEARVPGVPRADGRTAATGSGRARRAEGRAHARAAAGVTRWLTSIRPRSSIRGRCSARACKVLEGAVVGKQPTLSPRSTAKREELPPAEIGAGTIVSTGAIVFAGTTHRRARDRRRPVVRARARHDRRRRRRRPRLARRERHDDRRR